MVLSFESEAHQEQALLSSTDGFSLVPLDATPHRRLQNKKTGNGNKRECQCGDYVGGGCTLTSLDVAVIQAFIVDKIETWDTDGEDSIDVVGALLRLAFHDRASFSKNTKNTLNGMNGCLDLSDPGNTGLESVVSFVLEIQHWVSTAGDSSIGKYVSKADITALAGLTAVCILFSGYIFCIHIYLMIPLCLLFFCFYYVLVGVPLRPACCLGPQQSTPSSSLVRLSVRSWRYSGRNVRLL